MKTKLLLFCTVLASLALPACDDKNPLEDYVNQVVDLKVGDNGAVTGTLHFTRVHYYTVDEQQCDRVQCGTNWINTCDHRTVCTPGRQVCVPTGTPVCKIVNGKQECTQPTGGQSCHTEPGSCVSEDYNCRSIPDPIYCDANCRMVPVTHSNDIDVPSPVQVTVKGMSDLSQISMFSLGIKTNADFVNAVRDPSKRPDDIKDLFNALRDTDQTLLVLKAKGVRLSQGQPILEIPAGFKPGDTIQLSIQVESAGTGDTVSSAIGTSSDVPALVSSDN